MFLLDEGARETSRQSKREQVRVEGSIFHVEHIQLCHEGAHFLRAKERLCVLVERNAKVEDGQPEALRR